MDISTVGAVTGALNNAIGIAKTLLNAKVEAEVLQNRYGSRDGAFLPPDPEE